MIKDGDTITAAQSASSYGSMPSCSVFGTSFPTTFGSGRGSFVKYSIETILERHPDVVFILASSNDEASNRAMLEKFRNDEQWKHSYVARWTVRAPSLPGESQPNLRREHAQDHAGCVEEND